MSLYLNGNKAKIKNAKTIGRMKEDYRKSQGWALEQYSCAQKNNSVTSKYYFSRKPLIIRIGKYYVDKTPLIGKIVDINVWDR